MDVFVACFHIIYACNGSSGIDGRHFFRIGYKLSLTVDGHPSVAAVGNVQHTVIGGSCFGVGQLGCIQHFTAIAEGEKEVEIPPFVFELVVQTAVEVGIGIADDTHVRVINDFVSVPIIEFPHTGTYVATVECAAHIRNSFFQGVGLVFGIVVKVLNLI